MELEWRHFLTVTPVGSGAALLENQDLTGATFHAAMNGDYTVTAAGAEQEVETTAPVPRLPSLLPIAILWMVKSPMTVVQRTHLLN